MRFRSSLVSIGDNSFIVIRFNYNLPSNNSFDENNSPKINIQCTGSTILYMTRKSSILNKDALNINLSVKAENKFYIIHPTKEPFSFTIDGTEYSTLKMKSPLTAKQLEDLLYTLAYEEYSKGNSYTALNILRKSLNDKYLTDLLLNAFTVKERQSCTDALLAAAHNRRLTISPKLFGESRLLQGTLSKNDPPESSTCLMELLELFEKNGDKYIPISRDKYKRIGKAFIDNYNCFKIHETNLLTCNFNDIVFSKEKLNVSIRYKIPGSVTVNPLQAKVVKLSTNIFPAHIFREQTIIKDGYINMEELDLLVTKVTLDFLINCNIHDLFTVDDSCVSIMGNYIHIKLNLTKIPVIIEKYVSNSDNLDYVLDKCFEQKNAECKQKVLKYFLDRLSKNQKHSSLYTKQQQWLLKSFGLDGEGIYHSIDTKLADEMPHEYRYRFFEFSIKGYSTLPKVEHLLNKLNNEEKKLNGPEEIMARAIKYILDKKLDGNTTELRRLLEEQKRIIKSCTRILAQIRLSKTLSGSWWQGLALDSKDNYVYKNENKTLVIKLERKSTSI